MDLGCCVGQDTRSLSYAGVPGSRILGVDLERSFVDIGYDLFRDKDRLGAQFVQADIMKLESKNFLAQISNRGLVLIHLKAALRMN